MTLSDRRQRNQQRLEEILEPWGQTLQGGLSGRLLESFKSELITLLGRVETEERDRCLECVRLASREYAGPTPPDDQEGNAVLRATRRTKQEIQKRIRQ